MHSIDDGIFSLSAPEISLRVRSKELNAVDVLHAFQLKVIALKTLKYFGINEEMINMINVFQFFEIIPNGLISSLFRLHLNKPTYMLWVPVEVHGNYKYLNYKYLTLFNAGIVYRLAKSDSDV